MTPKDLKNRLLEIIGILDAMPDDVEVIQAMAVVELREGVLVTVQAGPAAGIYHVQVRHVLDEFKNEYEIAFSRDI